MVLGPIIPGRPTPAKPAAKTPTRVNTTSLAGVMAASKPKPTPVPRYIPANATSGGKTTKQVTAANNAAMAAGLIPAPTRSTRGVGGSSQTGSIETKSAPTSNVIGGSTKDGTTYGAAGGDGAGKPIEVTLPQEDMDAVQAAADALRNFQETQIRQQLQATLGKIDRAAIDQYKGIANDYAARGMARSGGFRQTEDRAEAERDRAVSEAEGAVTEFINELKYSGDLEQAMTNLSKSQAFQDYINNRLKPATGG